MTIKYRIIEALKSGVCSIKFVKADGTERIMNCTRNLDLVPVEMWPKASMKYNENPTTDQIDVFDIDSRGWRSFKLSRLVSMDLHPDMDLFDELWEQVRSGYRQSIPEVFNLTGPKVEHYK